MTATRGPRRSARPAPSAAGHPRLRPIRYGPLARFADWYQGWRDGRAEIPPKPSADGEPRIITTPHREATIRWALGGFEQERQRWEGLRASALERRAIATARRDSAAAALSAAQADLALASRPLTDAERHRRRLGEERRPDSVVVQRRLREHHRRAAAVRARAGQAERELAAAAQDLAAATEQVDRQLAMAQVRVLRIHQHAHKRMAAYRRTLLRWHKHSAWLSTAMAITEPELPAWAFPYAEPPPPPRPARPGEATVTPGEPEEATPTSRLPLFPRTVFGSTAPPAHYVALEGAPEHFALTRQADATYLLADLGHGEGPFINGQPVKTAILRPGGYFDFHDARYRISEDGTVLEVFPLYTTAGKYDFIVYDLNATNKKQPRLANMSFAQRSKELLAILGPSGAGKSSLFAALVGELTPQSGELYFLGMPLATHGPQIRATLGYVPQDESLFKTLTVRRLLRYAYRLREPGGSNSRDRRVEDVCAQLRITPQLDQLVGTLSGGQRKRVSIAMELLGMPLLLLLDEPTSGLDAGMDREVLTILSKYAAVGRTVMVITHSTEHLEIAGQVLVLARGGAPVYSGPPGRVLEHFSVDSYAHLMRALGEKDTTLVARQYQEGQEAALARTESARAAGLGASQRTEITRRGPVRTGIRQFWVLAQRQVMLLATRGITKNPADRRPRHLAMSVVTPLMPLIIAAIGTLLAGVVGSTAGLGPSHDAQAVALIPTTLSLLVTLCILSGQALTYGDVINDYATLRREHRTGTLTLSAMLAKWVVFAAVAILQALVITFIYVSFWPGPRYQVLFGPASDLFIGLAAMTIAAMTLGLLISSVFKKLEQAVAAVTGVSIAQIAFNGAFSDLSGNHALGAFAAILPSRWGVAAAASSINLRGISTAAYHDRLWQYSRGQWAFDLAALTVLGIFFLYLAIRIVSKRLNSPD